MQACEITDRLHKEDQSALVKVTQFPQDGHVQSNQLRFCAQLAFFNHVIVIIHD